MSSSDVSQKSQPDVLIEHESSSGSHRMLGHNAEAGEALPIEAPAARFGRSLAVIIGIDTYGEGIASLRSAVADARAIEHALWSDHGFETLSLFNEDARLADLHELLRKTLPSRLGPSDRLLFYFAGHGIASEGDAGPAGYLIPALLGARQRDSFIPMHFVHRELTHLPVRHALIILDCCFAGAFRWSSQRLDDVN